MAKKLTLEVIKERLKEINPNIEILSDVYINNNTKLKCRCLVDGYEWDTTWSSLGQGHGCAECSGKRKDYNIYEIRKKIHKINHNIEIISDKYTGSQNKLKCKCLLDGHEWYATWSNLSQGTGCPECAKQSKRLTLSQIKEKLVDINPNIEILSSEYKGANEKLKCKCLIDGHQWGARASTLLIGQGCPKCAGKNLSLEELKDKLKVISPDIEIISDTYVKSVVKLKVKCLKDGHQWEALWSSLKKGHGCPECAKKKFGSAQRLTIKQIKKKLKDIDPNIEILSEEYVNNSTKLKCKCKVDGYEWYVSWNSLSKSKGCPKCFNNIRNYTIEDIRGKLNIINPNIKILSDEYVGCFEKLKCKCLVDGYEWSSSWAILSMGHGCHVCANARRDYNIHEIRKKLHKINPNIEILSEEYISNRAKLKCKCLVDAYEWEASWGNLTRGTGCPECSGTRKDYTIEILREKLKIINPNIKIISTEYKRASQKLRCRCLLDDYEWDATWNSLFAKHGCPKCHGNLKPTLEEVKGRLIEINPDIEILSTDYKNAKSKLKCKCLIDSHQWDVAWDSLSRGIGCPKCSSSKGEKIISNILIDRNIKHKEQYKHENCRHKSRLRFDFALFDNNNSLISLIEYDGEQHFEPVDFAGKGSEWAIKQHKIVLKRDKIKNTYCKENNIPLLRIPYWEKDNIESILDEWLEKIGLIKEVSDNKTLAS